MPYVTGFFPLGVRGGEATLISVIGGVGGIAGSAVLMRALSLWQPFTKYPIHLQVNPDANVYGLALLLATSVFAATNKGSMQLQDPVTVSGKQLRAGDYSVKWDGSGPNVELSILKGNKVVATTPARLLILGRLAIQTASDADKQL